MAYDGPEFPGLGEIDQLLHDFGRSGLRIARTTLGFRTGAAILFSIRSMPNPLDPHLLQLTATLTGIERPSRIGTAPGSSTRWRVSSKIIGTARISFLRDGFCSTIQQIAYRGIRPDISDPLPDNTLIHIGGVVLPGYSTLLERPAPGNSWTLRLANSSIWSRVQQGTTQSTPPNASAIHFPFTRRRMPRAHCHLLNGYHRSPKRALRSLHIALKFQNVTTLINAHITP